MKKMLSILAAFTLIFGLSVKVFAAVAIPDPIPNNPGPFTDTETVYFNKVLDVVNEGTVNPEETFNFVIGTGSGLRDGENVPAPVFSNPNFTITIVKNGTTGTGTITLPEFEKVGVYTYPVTETESHTAGMRYDGETYYLVITVVNNPDYVVGGTIPEFLRVLTFLDPGLDVKTDEFENKFYAGDLTVRKAITGNFSDPDDVFTITVTVTPDDVIVDNIVTGFKEIKQEPIVWDTTDVSTNLATGVITAVYTLKGGESFTIENLPYDVSYTVVETQFPLYDLPIYDEFADNDMDAATISTTITNNRDTAVDTGISLDSLPYLVILGFAGFGMSVLFFRKRRNVNF